MIKFLKKLKKLGGNKTSQNNDIPLKIMKENIDIISYILYYNFNNLFDSELPSKVKEPDITTVYKKEEKYLKEIYRPVSILSNVSKVHETLMYDQINKYFGTILSNCSMRFSKRIQCTTLLDSIKRMLWPIFCIDINTHSDRK